MYACMYVCMYVCMYLEGKAAFDSDLMELLQLIKLIKKCINFIKEKRGEFTG